MNAITWERIESVADDRPAFVRWLHARRQDRVDAEIASRLAQRFIATVAGAGLCRHTESCAGIPGYATPQVLHVRLGEVPRLTVRMMPGQVPGDYHEIASALAEGLGVHRVRITRRVRGLIHVDLQATDGLAQPVPLPRSIITADHDLVLGGLDDGRLLRLKLSQAAHLLVQGQTRSGKSRFLYGLLAQISDAPDVLISGSDVTGLVLRPFHDTRHGHLIATGSANPLDHIEVLEHLVSIMDQRIDSMPPELDIFPCSDTDPYMVTLIEELPSLLRRVSGDRKLVDRLQTAYGRLLAEGAKGGFRLVIVTQRADAKIIGGYERGQCPVRISFPVDDPTAVKMLHPAASDDLCLMHLSGHPGQALVSMPGLPVVRMRSPEMESYQQFRTAVASPPVTESAEAAQ